MQQFARRLIRLERQPRDVARLDMGMYGYLVSRVAHAHPNGGQYDVSMALGEAQRALQKEATKPGKDFGELVRERRRRFGLPNPPAGKVLPFRWSHARSQRPETSVVSGAGASALRADDLAPEGSEQERKPTELAPRSPELRMQEALEALDAAALSGGRPAELEQIEAAFAGAQFAYIAACQRLKHR